MSESNDTLYHVKSIVINFYTDPTDAIQKVEIVGTYTDLAEAKVAAKKAFFDLGYRADLFEEYLGKEGSSSWTFGDGTSVHSRAPTGEDFTVRIETIPNVLNIQPGQCVQESVTLSASLPRGS